MRRTVFFWQDAERVPRREDEDMEKIDIRSLEPDELKEWIGELGEKPFRAEQIYEWLHGKKAEDFGEMITVAVSGFKSNLVQ